MRRALAPALAAGVVLLLLAAVPVRAAPPRLSAPAFTLMETSTGRTLYSRHRSEARAIASTTKMMTVLVALDRLPLHRTLVVPPYAISSAESAIGLRTGERMTVADLVRAALLPSANDAAHALAVRAGGGSLTRFVELMNRRARALGLHHTHFETPVGLDTPGNYSSPADLARLAVALRRNAFARRTMAEGHAVLRSGSHVRVVLNRNDLVRRYGWINGVKTGHTLSAGYILVGSGTQRGMTLIASVLGTPSEGVRDADTLALLSWGFRAYRLAHPVRRGQVVGHAAVAHDPHATVRLVAGRALSAVVRRSGRVRLLLRAPRTITGPKPRGYRAGTLVVRSGRRVLGRLPVRTATRVKAVSLAAQIFRGTRGAAIVVVAVAAAALALFAETRRRRERRRSSRRRRRPMKTA